MEAQPNIEVEILGPILEGRGAISSSLEKAGYKEFAQAIKESVAKIQDHTPACVDGRRCLCQLDGSGPKIRPRIAGASLAAFVMCGLGSDEFLRPLTSQNKTLGGVVERIEHLQSLLDNPLGAHIDCGAGGGLTKHLASLAGKAKPNSKIVARLMAKEVPDFDITASLNRIRARANFFGKFLETVGWDGQEFEQNIADLNPGGVEKLESDMAAPNHGHAEDAWVVIDGLVDANGRPLHSLDDEKLHQLTGRRAFVLNLNSLRHGAGRFSTSPRQKNELMCAGLDWHLNGVSYNLTDGSQPVFFVTIS